MPPTPLPVRFRDVFDALKLSLAGETLYLNRMTGELELVRESSITGLCDVDEDAIPAKEKALIEHVRKIVNSSDWLALPGFIHEADYAVLLRFAQELDERHRRPLETLIKRRFSHPILEYLEEQELETSWFIFRRRQFYSQLKDCLEKNGLVLLGEE